MNATHRFLRLIVAVCAIGACAGAQAVKPLPPKTYKILHIMSYHTPWRWTEEQLNGFKEGLGPLATEYKVFEMDTKRRNSPEWKEQKGKEARALIESWKPDLVYTTDDDVQEYVVKRYVNTDIPFVFSGVNKHPSVYGFEGSRNVTGVLEHEHFVESLKLLRAIVPSARRVVVVFDEAPMWSPVRARMIEGAAQLPEIEIVAWDTIRTFEDYKRKLKEYPASADAIALIGIFNFKDANGKNVPYQDVLRWTAENSRLPDIGFWVDRVHHGTLVAMTVSEREQGFAAGRLARAILVDGKRPAELPMRPTVKGSPAISLARANTLGLKVTSSLLLSAEVIEKYEWDK